MKKGEIVVATARKPEVLDDLKAKYPATQFITAKLDVDKIEDIKNAFAKAKEAFGRIDVVFNNAGWVPVGETEAHPEEDARKLFDTNFWGCANVSREAVRFFRDENKPSGGVLLVNSSMSGLRSVPVMAYYSASKHGTFTISVSSLKRETNLDCFYAAVEGITQALAMELDPTWNIKASCKIVRQRSTI